MLDLCMLEQYCEWQEVEITAISMPVSDEMGLEQLL